MGPEVVWSGTSVSYTNNEKWSTPTSKKIQLILPNKAAYHNSKVLYKYDYGLMRSIAPQAGAAVEYVSWFPPHGVTGIHSVILLILACVKKKHKGIQVTYIVSCRWGLTIITQHNYNEVEPWKSRERTVNHGTTHKCRCGIQLWNPTHYSVSLQCQ